MKNPCICEIRGVIPICVHICDKIDPYDHLRLTRRLTGDRVDQIGRGLHLLVRAVDDQPGTALCSVDPAGRDHGGIGAGQQLDGVDLVENGAGQGQ